MSTLSRTCLAFVCSTTLTIATVSAQDSERNKTTAIRGATVHTLAGPAIENGTVLIRDGRIAEVGTDVTIPGDAETIDASGLHVYPGMFDSVSQIGLTEIGAVAATVDTSELGEFNPQLKAITAVHPSSEHIPVARANGITHAVAAPGSGGGRGGSRFGIQGQASVIHLNGWTAEEMELSTSVAMVIQWPTLSTRTFDRATFTRGERPYSEVEKEYQEKVAELKNVLAAARHYRSARKAGGERSRAEYDDKLDALGGVVDGSMSLMIRAETKKQLEDAIEFSTQENVRIILAGATESWMVKDALVEHQIPVILGPTQALPRHDDAPYDRAFTTAGELHKAGVKIAFATFGSANSRTLPYEAGHAVGFGLSKDEGLRAVTVNPAEILGLSNEIGTIEEGKWANIIVTNGDPLEIRTEFRHVFVKGENTDLMNKHLELYEKYRSRPASKK